MISTGKYFTFVEQRDTDNLLSASDNINFAFNFALTVTCKVKTILLIFYGAETAYT